MIQYTMKIPGNNYNCVPYKFYIKNYFYNITSFGSFVLVLHHLIVIYVPSFDSIFFFYNLLEAGTAGVMEAPLNGNGGLSIKAGGGGDVDGYNAWGATGPPACH